MSLELRRSCLQCFPSYPRPAFIAICVPVRGQRHSAQTIETGAAAIQNSHQMRECHLSYCTIIIILFNTNIYSCEFKKYILFIIPRTWYNIKKSHFFSSLPGKCEKIPWTGNVVESDIVRTFFCAEKGTDYYLMMIELKEFRNYLLCEC